MTHRGQTVPIHAKRDDGVVPTNSHYFSKPVMLDTGARCITVQAFKVVRESRS